MVAYGGQELRSADQYDTAHRVCRHTDSAVLCGLTESVWLTISRLITFELHIVGEFATLGYVGYVALFLVNQVLRDGVSLPT